MRNYIKHYIFILFCLVSSEASAALVTFNYTGMIDRHTGLSSDLHALMPVGSSFSGSYTFDTSYQATDIQPNDASYNGAISRFHLEFGSYYATLDNGGLRLIDNKEVLLPVGTAEYDSYIVQGRTGHPDLPTSVDTNIVLSDYVSGSLTSGWHLNWLRIDAYDPLAMLLDSISLQSSPPDITGQDFRFEFGFLLDCCTGETRTGGYLTSLEATVVPEIKTVWLFVLALSLMKILEIFKIQNNGVRLNLP